ncbi:YbhB/YbcL family Raf kinase inhibitor-like protein [uncultured Lacticaseibacillus sp.]|uniref:YbhB/YbcL family Raf kinase inhibitor-like protein n=1 Tax=uncultured Lacticaseibacillus sp. TaxID=2775882 RepID=UPI00259144F1|nr:YbhB/YbcL family Raf kinase inhibitor-like protein [uncultured Lacticaseibacillus sp.]
MLSLLVSSPEFHNGHTMRYDNSAWGGDHSPEIHIMGVPAKAATLAVTMVDEDVLGHHQRPHWVMWNIDPRDRIPGHILPGKHVTEIMGAVQGEVLGRHGYCGPKPTWLRRITHHYVFTVYALDNRLSLPTRANYHDFIHCIRGHVLCHGSLTGLFSPANK